MTQVCQHMYQDHHSQGTPVEIQVIKRRLPPEQKARRDQIIACAQQLILEHGAAVSMEMVAAAAGTSRSTLYRNFTSREHLIADVTLAAGHQLIRMLSSHSMAGKTVGENVTWLCEQIAAMAKNNETFLAVCIGNLSAEDPAVIDAHEEIEDLISGLLNVATGNVILEQRERAEQTIFRYLLGCFVLATSAKMTFEDVSHDLQVLCQQMLTPIWEEPFTAV